MDRSANEYGCPTCGKTCLHPAVMPGSARFCTGCGESFLPQEATPAAGADVTPKEG